MGKQTTKGKCLNPFWQSKVFLLFSALDRARPPIFDPGIVEGLSLIHI